MAACQDVGRAEPHFREFNGLDLQTGGKRTPDINKLRTDLQTALIIVHDGGCRHPADAALRSKHTRFGGRLATLFGHSATTEAQRRCCCAAFRDLCVVLTFRTGRLR